MVGAVGVDRSDRIAAGFIVAPWRTVREAAGPGAGVAALGSRAGVEYRTCAVLTVVVAGGLSLGRAVDVPFVAAAEDVQQADRIAAGGVITAGCTIRAAAIAGAWIAAFEFTVRALRALACKEDTEIIPGAFVAAEGVLVADGFTACGIVAIGGFVGDAAGAGFVVTAFRSIAFGECHRTAIRVPGRLAAERIDFADLGTTGAFTAAGADLGDEAASRGRDTAAGAAAFFREQRTGAIPAVAAAEGVDLADGRAAGGVGAIRSVLGSQAASGTEVAAAVASLADRIGDPDTGGIPFDLTTVRVVGFAIEVGIEDADRLAARFNFAAGVVVVREAVSAAGTDRVG